MALQEFRSNKLRTFLSLLAITFGILYHQCIGNDQQHETPSFKMILKHWGTNTVFIDKMDTATYNTMVALLKRPTPKYENLNN